MALGYTGYLHVAGLRARAAPQGRPVGAKDPSHAAGADHRARRRQANAAGAEGLCRGRRWRSACTARGWSTSSGPRRVRRGRATRRDLLLDMLTPIAKSWPSQWCLEANNLAIQVHGGYGYTREYDVEQHYRDNRLNPIHEGTHGIQALDLLGRKVVDGRRRRARRCWPSGSARRRPRGRRPAARPRRSPPSSTRASDDVLARSPRRCGRTGDPALALANASVYLEAAGHVVVAWMWLEQLLAADGRRRRVLRRQAAGGAVLLPRTSCRRSGRSSICWSRSTGPRWTWTRPPSRTGCARWPGRRGASARRSPGTVAPHVDLVRRTADPVAVDRPPSGSHR